MLEKSLKSLGYGFSHQTTQDGFRISLLKACYDCHYGIFGYCKREYLTL